MGFMCQPDFMTSNWSPWTNLHDVEFRDDWCDSDAWEGFVDSRHLKQEQGIRSTTQGEFELCTYTVYCYRTVSNIRRTKSQNLNASRLTL